MKKFIRAHYILIGIIVLAAFFRYWQINTLPAGLFPDEAANGLDVNSILNGDIQPFYERGNGREALFFYLLALSVSLFGRGVWQHHIVSAGFGLAEVLATYFLVKHLFGKRTAYLASFFMAVSSYAVTLSRTAFRANTAPLFAILTLLFLIKFFDAQKLKLKLTYAFLSGLSFGLGFYTYISFRMMVPLLLVFGVVLLYGFRSELKYVIQTYWKPKLMFVAGFVVSFAWLGYYFITHPGTFVGRAGQVSIFSPELNQGDLIGTFFEVFGKTMLAFFANGDLNWRHNVSGEPFLSPIISPLFGLGLVVFSWAIISMLWQAYNKNLQKNTVYMALVAVWFWFMLVPEITTAEGIPHGLRLIGIIPAIFIFPAFIANWIWEKVLDKPMLAHTKIRLASVFLVGLVIYNYVLYFQKTANSPENYYAFRSDLTIVSKYLHERNNKAQTYLSLDKFSVQTVDYLTTTSNQPYVLLDPAQTYKVDLNSKDVVVFTQSTMFDRLKFLQAHPDARLINEQLNKFGQPVMLVYQKP